MVINVTANNYMKMQQRNNKYNLFLKLNFSETGNFVYL